MAVITIGHQTGNISFGFRTKVYQISDQMTFSFGQSGVSGAKLSLSGVSGEFFDNEGSVVHSYTDTLDISGNIFADRYSLFTDKKLLKNVGSISNNVDINYFEFSKNSSIGQTLDLRIHGEDTGIQNRSVYYATGQNGAKDQPYISYLSGMGIKVNPSGTYTGTIPSGLSGGLNNADLVIVGVTAELSGTSGVADSWKNVRSPVLSLNSSIVNYSGLNWISGSEAGLDYSSGYISSPSGFFNKISTGINSQFSLYSVTGSGVSFSSTSGVVSLTGVDGSAIVTDWPRGIETYSGGISGSRNRRILLNVPIGSGFNDLVTDDWKKLFSNIVFQTIKGL